MPLTLPNLDDLTWDELVKEGLARIPSTAPEWTNHNASDPGITLVELFAFYTSLLTYRANRIGDRQTGRFFELLNGPERVSKHLNAHSLEALKRATVVELTRPRRAVTASDFESFAMDNIDAHGSQEMVARAKCVPNKIFVTNFKQDLATEVELTNLYATSDSVAAPGHLTVIVLPVEAGRANEALLQRLATIFDQVRLLTTHVHVALPKFVEFSVRVMLGVSANAQPRLVRAAAFAGLKAFFDPYTGGPEGNGWPFGRNIYVSDIYQVLGNIPGIEYVVRNKNPETKRVVSELKIEPEYLDRLRFNRFKEVEAIEVHEGELVSLSLRLEHIAIDMEANAT